MSITHTSVADPTNPGQAVPDRCPSQHASSNAPDARRDLGTTRRARWRHRMPVQSRPQVVTDFYRTRDLSRYLPEARARRTSVVVCCASRSPVSIAWSSRSPSRSNAPCRPVIASTSFSSPTRSFARDDVVSRSEDYVGQRQVVMLRGRAKRWQEPRSDNAVDHDIVAAARERCDGPTIASTTTRYQCGIGPKNTEERVEQHVKSTDPATVIALIE